MLQNSNLKNGYETSSMPQATPVTEVFFRQYSDLLEKEISKFWNNTNELGSIRRSFINEDEPADAGNPMPEPRDVITELSNKLTAFHAINEKLSYEIKKLRQLV